jgi:LmbE family N-acetylglucosaminyl deacetylase
VSTEPAAFFQGKLLFAAPHMDDEVLACGGTIALLPHKERIHVVYATDGSRSPVPAFNWQGRRSPDLPRIRQGEARSALEVLEVPEDNVHFLNLPDGGLQGCATRVREELLSLLERVRPSCLFIPFRYDRHPDHVALRVAALQASELLRPPVQLVEYFVYYRWQLVPGRDIRAMIRPEHLLRVDIHEQSGRKRRALECYVSQTTRFFRWQQRPILPPERVAEVSRSDELFLKYNPEFPDATIFFRLQRWIPFVHRWEPFLKRRKDEIRLLVRAGLSGRTDDHEPARAR